jgi:hypothetical protein
MRVSVVSVFAAAAVAAEVKSPVTKVVQLLQGLAAKVNREGEVEQNEYETLVMYCEDNAKSLQHSLKNSAEKQQDLEATIQKANADIDGINTKIEQHATAIKEAEEELEAATQVRNDEHKEWVATDAELAKTADELETDQQIMKKDMAKNGFLQTGAAQKVTQSISMLLDARGLDYASKTKLNAFLQSQDEAADGMDMSEMSHAEPSGGLAAILHTLDELLKKAEKQRADAQKAETTAQFNYDMLKQSLTEQIKSGSKEQAEAKQKLAATQEVLSTAEGDLQSTKDDASNDSQTLRELQTDCMQKASDHETSVKERAEELKALATAKKAVEDSTGAADSRGFLLQMSSEDSTSGVPGVVHMLHELSEKQGDMRLSLLASQITSAAASSTGDDPFAKVKGLIREMLEKLGEEAEKEAKKHEYCTKAMKEAETKVNDSQSELDKTISKIDKAEATIVQLQEKKSTLQGELSELESMKGEATAIRQQQHEEYLAAKKDYEDGIGGVQMAIKVLKDYYGKNSDLLQTQGPDHSGAAGGIIGLLEVAESDFSKLLAEVEADEDAAEKEFVKMVKDSKVAKAKKTTALKYAVKEKAQIEKTLTELKDDESAQQEGVDAALDYQSDIKKECVAKPETYEERVARRTAEIEGLKNALQILEEEGSGGESFLALTHVHHRQ